MTPIAIVAGNAAPILGSSIYRDASLIDKIVTHDTTVFFALDYDVEKKALSIIKQLLEYGIEIYKIDTYGCDDVGTMTREEFENRKKNAVLMDQERILEYKLQMVN